MTNEEKQFWQERQYPDLLYSDTSTVQSGIYTTVERVVDQLLFEVQGQFFIYRKSYNVDRSESPYYNSVIKTFWDFYSIVRSDHVNQLNARIEKVEYEGNKNIITLPHQSLAQFDSWKDEIRWIDTHLLPVLRDEFICEVRQVNNHIKLRNDVSVVKKLLHGFGLDPSNYNLSQDSPKPREMNELEKMMNEDILSGDDNEPSAEDIMDQYGFMPQEEIEQSPPSDNETMDWFTEEEVENQIANQISRHTDVDGTKFFENVVPDELQRVKDLSEQYDFVRNRVYQPDETKVIVRESIDESISNYGVILPISEIDFEVIQDLHLIFFNAPEPLVREKILNKDEYKKLPSRHCHKQ